LVGKPEHPAGVPEGEVSVLHQIGSHLGAGDRGLTLQGFNLITSLARSPDPFLKVAR
jgi:hypothetical protein